MKNSFELIPNTKEDFEAVPDGEKEEYKSKLAEEAAELSQIENTNGLKAALENEVPEAAESFLNNVKSNREKFPQYDDRWIDQRERDIFNAYYDKNDQAGAERVLEKTEDIFSKKGRVDKFEKKFGKYDKNWISKVELKEYEWEEIQSLEVEDTASFRKALKMLNIKKAEEWLNSVRMDRSYGGMVEGDGKFENFIQQRRDDIKFIKEIQGGWE